MGWTEGTRLGRVPTATDGTEGAAWEQQFYAVGRGRYAGLGADTIADHSKGYMKYLDQFLAQCRSCQVTPLDWHRSQAFPAEKHNNKEGILGK
eukprot:1626855-Pyramimonas_sp.AAC.1